MKIFIVFMEAVLVALIIFMLFCIIPEVILSFLSGFSHAVNMWKDVFGIPRYHGP